MYPQAPPNRYGFGVGWGLPRSLPKAVSAPPSSSSVTFLRPVCYGVVPLTHRHEHLRSSSASSCPFDTIVCPLISPLLPNLSR